MPSDQHKASMDHMHDAVAKAKNKPLVSRSPLAQSLTTLNSQGKACLMKKFDICYFWLAKVLLSTNTLVSIH